MAQTTHNKDVTKINIAGIGGGCIPKVIKGLQQKSRAKQMLIIDRFYNELLARSENIDDYFLTKNSHLVAIACKLESIDRNIEAKKEARRENYDNFLDFMKTSYGEFLHEGGRSEISEVRKRMCKEIIDITPALKAQKNDDVSRETLGNNITGGTPDNPPGSSECGDAPLDNHPDNHTDNTPDNP